MHFLKVAALAIITLIGVSVMANGQAGTNGAWQVSAAGSNAWKVNGITGETYFCSGLRLACDLVTDQTPRPGTFDSSAF